MYQLPAAFNGLKANRQFVIGEITPKLNEDGSQQIKPNGSLRWDKIPCNDNGHKLEWRNAENLISYEESQQRHSVLQATYPHRRFEPGYIFTRDDGYVFLDLDNCIANGQYSALALDVMRRFPGAAIEISSSGLGIHMIFRAVSVIRTRCKNADGTIEVYTGDKFMMFGYPTATGNCDIDHTEAYQQFVSDYMLDRDASSPGVGDLWERWAAALTELPHPHCTPISDDTALIEAMLRSKATADEAFSGQKSKIHRLWHGDRTGYTSDSEADAALAGILCWWTGNHADRVERLMWLSESYRDKYDRAEYLPRTILYSRGKQTSFYNRTQEVQSTPLSSNSQQVLGFSNLDHQASLFTGCVYVADENRILTPGGHLRTQEQFKALYGGFMFNMDPMNEKFSKNAWEVFTMSRAIANPKVDSCCFRPDLDPGAITTVEGDRLVNTYWPITTARSLGNIAPLKKHLEKFLPCERDRHILLCYLAAIVQHKGIKFQWCPLLQGVQGNGKSLLSNIITFCVGHKYSSSIKASVIDDKFNDWLYRKIFIVIEEVYTIENRLETGEKLKDTISNSRQMIETKGLPMIMRDICANFVLNSNHKDAIRLTEEDRRFAVFFTGQQSKSDLIRDGMTKEFFVETYDWLQKHNGLAICNEFFHSFPISKEFNPAFGGRAPTTSSTLEAIAESRGSVEQEVLEAIEQGRIGFRGGFISSIYFSNFLESIRSNHKVPHKKRRLFMESIGYVLHPSFPQGQVDNPIQPDQGKPRLYVHKDHPARHILDPKKVILAYTEAQK